MSPMTSLLSLAAAVAILTGAGRARAQSEWDAAEQTEIGDDAPEGATLPPARPTEGGDDGPAAGDASDAETEGAGLDLAGAVEEGGGGTITLWGELAMHAGPYTYTHDAATVQVSGISFSPLVGAAYHATQRIRVGAMMGLATSILTDAMAGGTDLSGLAFRLGNPALTVDLVGPGDGDLRWRLGAGITLPIASPGDTAESIALDLAAAMRGAWNFWLWAPSRITPYVTGRAEIDLGERLVAGVDAGAGVLLDVSDGGEPSPFILQLAVDGDYRLAGRFSVGARVTAVLVDEVFPERESAQIALMPYVRLANEAGDGFLTAGFVFNLDPPYGPSFADGNAWGLRVGAGTVL
jgi:hypothetical protein